MILENDNLKILKNKLSRIKLINSEILKFLVDTKTNIKIAEDKLILLLEDLENSLLFFNKFIKLEKEDLKPIYYLPKIIKEYNVLKIYKKNIYDDNIKEYNFIIYDNELIKDAFLTRQDLFDFKKISIEENDIKKFISEIETIILTLNYLEKLILKKNIL